MKLKEIQVKNFRSIKEHNFIFNRNFQILVGINESGKSNLLKAVSLLNEQIKFTKDDIRDPCHDEDTIDESYVRFIFITNSKIQNNAVKALNSQILSNDISSPLLDIDNDTYNLDEFCTYKKEILYVIDLQNDFRGFKHWNLSGNQYRIYSNWKKIKDGIKYNFALNNKQIELEKFKIVNISDHPNIPDNLTEDLTISSLNTLVGSELIKAAKPYIPDCIVWNYNEDNLLPSRIDLSDFSSNPNICIPLKNMFELAGYYDIQKEINNAQNKTNGMRNILRRISKKTTKHMLKVWPDWKKQNVSLIQNGEFVEAGIEDEYNIYSLSRRSDGFKRFFTFLLMISVQNQTKEIQDNLIVIDEPDIGLHPSGIQYLREELKKIGEQNMILVSTHSIFMIDRDFVDRHLIVEKTKEITEIKHVDVSNIDDEEVIYKALGFSLYELLKPFNIIFEGWRDKRIFELYMNSAKGKGQLTIGKNGRTGLLHAIGVKDVPRIANTCENFNRDYIIISDSDTVAKEKKHLFGQNNKWFCLDEIINNGTVTTEDMISNKLLNKVIREVFESNAIPSDLTLDDSTLVGKIKVIELYLAKHIEDKQLKKNIINQIKDKLCNKVKASDLIDKYNDLFTFIVSKVPNP